MKQNKHSQALRLLTAVFLCLILLCSTFTVEASAATLSPASVPVIRPQVLNQNNNGTGIQEVDDMFDNIAQILFGLCRFAGGAVLLFGIVQIAISLSSHDSSQKIQGFFFAGAGVLVLFAPNIVQAIQA